MLTRKQKITSKERYRISKLHRIENDIRTEVDFRNESLGFKIRQEQTQKIPYMLVIGEKETVSGGVSTRLRSGKNLGLMKLDDFVELIKMKCREETQARPLKSKTEEDQDSKVR